MFSIRIAALFVGFKEVVGLYVRTKDNLYEKLAQNEVKHDVVLQNVYTSDDRSYRWVISKAGKASDYFYMNLSKDLEYPQRTGWVINKKKPSLPVPTVEDVTEVCSRVVTVLSGCAEKLHIITCFRGLKRRFCRKYVKKFPMQIVN